MTEIRFYHLQRQRIENVLPALLVKALTVGYRIAVHSPDESVLKELDKHLWTYHPESFLPHGTGKGKNATRHPVWLGSSYESPNNATMLVELGPPSPQMLKEKKELAEYSLICLLFEEWREDLLASARQCWKSLKGDTQYALSYWQQKDSGGWEKKS